MSDQKGKAKSNRNRNCIFSFPWRSQGTHIGSFLLCFTYPSQLPLQTATYMDELLEIFLKLSMKTVQVHLIMWTTLSDHPRYFELFRPYFLLNLHISTYPYQNKPFQASNTKYSTNKPKRPDVFNYVNYDTHSAYQNTKRLRWQRPTGLIHLHPRV